MTYLFFNDCNTFLRIFKYQQLNITNISTEKITQTSPIPSPQKYPRFSFPKYQHSWSLSSASSFWENRSQYFLPYVCMRSLPHSSPNDELSNFSPRWRCHREGYRLLCRQWRHFHGCLGRRWRGLYGWGTGDGLPSSYLSWCCRFASKAISSWLGKITQAK